MATFDYARAKLTADRLIARFGRTAILRKLTPGAGPAYNPGAPTVTDHAVTLARIGYTNKERDGTIIRAGDDRFYIAVNALSVEPLPSDRIVIGSEVWNVIAVQPLVPASTVVMWDLQVRK